ncbi:MAG: hypothetical protein Q7S06_03990 [Nanoarchaeota archaeon]|nr:hypothetical protein [Nanoarchaeota archaeon]
MNKFNLSLKKSKEIKGFKKIILTFWIWWIIAVIFMFITASFIPAGTYLKNIFVYMIRIPLLIGVVLLIVNIIKSIQKSKIGDYWKVAWTVIGIIGVVLLVFFDIKGMIEDNSNQRIKEYLEEKGYEVLRVGAYNVSCMFENNCEPETAYVNMKSLGDKSEQVNDALITLFVNYPEVIDYTITLLTPEKECYYNIKGDIYRASLGEGIYLINGTQIDEITLYRTINSEIEKQTKSCS